MLHPKSCLPGSVAESRRQRFFFVYVIVASLQPYQAHGRRYCRVVESFRKTANPIVASCITSDARRIRGHAVQTHHGLSVGETLLPEGLQWRNVRSLG